jgi:hypothetical protein
MEMAEKSNWQEVRSFVALFDILGFKELLKNSEVGTVAATYDSMRREISKYTDDINRALQSKVVSRCFSDTFLLYTVDTTKESFDGLVIACFFLYFAAISNKLCLRGAITVGDLLVTDGMEIGRPIVKAYNNEQKQDWMGCWIDDECLSQPQQYLDRKWIVKYQIPLKGKECLCERYALNWLYLFCDMDSRLGLRAGSRPFDKRRISKLINISQWNPENWDQKRKVDNTKRFLNFVSGPEFLAHYNSMARPK